MTPLNNIPAAMSLVRAQIPGRRKGSRIPAYQHSITVYEILREHGFSKIVCLAGLLHDIVEDGGLELPRLKKMGFSTQVIKLVDLCSHDMKMPAGDARWVKMLARLIQADNKNAWAVKLADMLDNVRSCQTMPLERAEFFRGVKARLVLSVTKNRFGRSALWRELAAAVEKRQTNY